MAPSFLSLKSIRRRSKASGRTDKSADTSSDGEASLSHGTFQSGASTPPSLNQKSDDALNMHSKDESQPSPRPSPAVNGSNRYSVAGSVSGMAGLGSPTATGSPTHLPISQYAPRIANLADCCWVSRTTCRRTHDRSPGSWILRGSLQWEKQRRRGAGNPLPMRWRMAQADKRRADVPKGGPCAWNRRGVWPAPHRRDPYHQSVRRRFPAYFVASVQLAMEGTRVPSSRPEPVAVRLFESQAG